MKKITTLVLPFLLLLLLNCNSHANEIIDCGECGTSLTWKIDNDGNLIIEGNGTMTNYNVTGTIAPWYTYKDFIKSIKIESDVTVVDDYAFSGLNLIETIYWNAVDCTVNRGLYGYPLFNYINDSNNIDVIFGNGVKKIPDDAFTNCKGLRSIVMSDTVSDISSGAFSNCTRLTNVELSENLTNIGNSAFAGCSSIEEITIPNSVTSIGKYALKDCSNLSKIKLSNRLTKINEQVFWNCVSLIEITIPEGVKTIAFESFRHCESLKIIRLPKSIKTIERNAFYNTKNIEMVYYAGNKNDWNKINFELSYTNSELLNAQRIYNYKPASAEITSASSTPTSLKFVSTVATEGEPEIATFGTTFIPLWLFETGSSDVATVSYDNSKYDIQNGQTFGATLGGIPEAAKDMVIVGKSFIKDADGNYTWSAAKSASVNNTELVELR